MRLIPLILPIALCGTLTAATVSRPYACEITIYTDTPLPPTSFAANSDLWVNVYVKNTGTVAFTVSSHTASLSSGFTLTDVSGAQGNTLQPGEYIDAQIFFTTGSAATGQWIHSDATASCGDSTDWDHTGLTIN